MEIKLKDFVKPDKIVAFVNFSGSFQKFKNNSKVSYVLDIPYKQNMIARKYLEKTFSNLSQDKLEKACRMALLDLSILDCNLNKLSRTEAKRLRFVEALLYNSETLIFVNFEDGFYGKKRGYYQKLFLKLTKYHKAILVVTKDVSFLFGMVSEFILFTDHSYEWMRDFYDQKIYQYVEEPPIISYVNYLNRKGIRMEHYVEPKEVLKAIYRSVNSKEHL